MHITSDYQYRISFFDFPKVSYILTGQIQRLFSFARFLFISNCLKQCLLSDFVPLFPKFFFQSTS